jgi:rare lipoprotein A
VGKACAILALTISAPHRTAPHRTALHCNDAMFASLPFSCTDRAAHAEPGTAAQGRLRAPWASTVPGMTPTSRSLRALHVLPVLHLRQVALLRALLWMALTAALLAGCSTSGPRRDGPGDRIPADLAQVPDAEPRVENVRTGGPNKPYQINGRWYKPVLGDLPLRERGLASWYGAKFHGKPTANGERYDMFAMTAAHKTLPLPSYARVRNPANGREVVVRVNDRGPFVDGRVIDLSYTAALRLGLLRGVAPVEVERLTNEQIAAGSWRRGDDGGPAATSPAPPEAGTVARSPDPRPPSEPPMQPVVTDDPLGLLLADRGWVPREGPQEAPREVARDMPREAQPQVPQLPQAALTPGLWLQLGVFGDADGAEQWRQRLLQAGDDLEDTVRVVVVRGLVRVMAGPYRSRDEALRMAVRLQALVPSSPFVVEQL